MPFVYQTTDPTERYDSDKFKEKVENFRKLESGLTAIVKDSGDTDALASLGKILQGDPTFYYHSHPQNPSVGARKEATNKYRKENERLEDYVTNNAESLVSEFIGDADKVKKLLENELENEVKIETTNDNFKKYVDLIRERRDIFEAIKDPRKLSAYVSKKLEGESEEDQDSYAFLSGSEYYDQILFKSYSNEVLKKLGEEEAKLSEEDLKNLAFENIRKARGEGDKMFFRVLMETAIPKPNPQRN